MFYSLFNFFVKITGWPVQFFCFRKKIFYEDRNVQSRRIKGKAVIVLNHTSVFDYPLIMFVFFMRTVRYQMSELVMEKPVLGTFLRMLGGIYVDRNSHDYACIRKSQRILENGGVIGINPEGRIPRPGEATPLKFEVGAAYLAISTDTLILPVYTDGSYFNLRSRANVIIGTPIVPSEYVDESLSDKDNLQKLTDVMREKIIYLGKMLDEKKKG